MLSLTRRLSPGRSPRAPDHRCLDTSVRLRVSARRRSGTFESVSHGARLSGSLKDSLEAFGAVDLRHGLKQVQRCRLAQTQRQEAGRVHLVQRIACVEEDPRSGRGQTLEARHSLTHGDVDACRVDGEVGGEDLGRDRGQDVFRLRDVCGGGWGWLASGTQCLGTVRAYHCIRPHWDRPRCCVALTRQT